MSSKPGPLCGSSPVEQIGRYGRHAEMMFSPGAEMSGHVCGRVRSPREEKSDTAPSRVPVDWSLYDATDRMPGVGSWPGGLEWLTTPSSALPPSFPLAHTVITPSRASASWILAVAELGSNSPPPIGPNELLMALIGGQVLAGTPAPQ